MAQTEVTLNEIMLAVRELTFDRFIIPAFAVKQLGSGYFLTVDRKWEPTDLEDGEILVLGRLLIDKRTSAEGEAEPTVEEVISLPFLRYPLMDDIMNKLIEEGIIVAYTPYFRGTEPSTALIQVTKELTEDHTLFRRYFFSDTEIAETIRWYYLKILDVQNVELTTEIVSKLQRPSEKHLAIWVAYHLVDKRRLYENAANAIGQSFTDGSDYMGSGMTTSPTSTTVQIGSVFSITEDASQGFFYEDYNRVGSDNVWGDRYSFWYKLMLYLRGLLEETFGDYSLRKDNVLQGEITLTRELDFRSYYDSYPFTLSPLSRGILSKTP